MLIERLERVNGSSPESHEGTPWKYSAGMEEEEVRRFHAIHFAIFSAYQYAKLATHGSRSENLPWRA